MEDLTQSTESIFIPTELSEQRNTADTNTFIGNLDGETFRVESLSCFFTEVILFNEPH